MVIFKLYSKRQKAVRGEVPEIFSYDAPPLRINTGIEVYYKRKENTSFLVQGDPELSLILY